MKHLARALFVLVIATWPLFAQTNSAPEPRPATYCELSRDPAAYNHKLIRLTAFVTHGFEDFQIAEPDCPTQGFSIWLMYGGTAESNTMYCCPGEAGAETRFEPLTIEGINIPLVRDQTFRQFADLLREESDTTVRTTIEGTFFSGRNVQFGESTRWRGFGHMGCCSLFVIQRVNSFEPHTRSDLDYTAEAGWYEGEGCKWGSEQDRRHVSVDNWKGAAAQAIAEQEAADNGQPWAFSDPQRVAIESLKALYPGHAPTLRRVKRTPGRQVFRWRDGKKSIVVVVARPYWLSFYAASNSVAWVSTMIKEADCE
jgi:hypothetical protein